MSKLAEEFKAFIMRGNVIDMAVGVIIGAAFSNIVSSLVNDIVMPVVTLVTGRINFTDLMIPLDGNSYSTLAAAQEAGASVIAYGNFIQMIVEFLLTALVIFFVIKGINKLHKPAPEPEVTTKICPFCKSEVHKDATKCPNCTSAL
ncbi:MAG: large conductance mechanosensitive channel protein MscL [Lachnospiraceae bacterium]|nr:large conductance mechanosensitive channel protein MscL [Clostridiales bacterium]MCD7716404.1 large conductance mechanosensitive channel protein MscL [Lachnospiraceae bacterium]MCD7765471.1 large conductance mechanosensitive channel protein MscL [Lachnospiraceae bacterium]